MNFSLQQPASPGPKAPAPTRDLPPLQPALPGGRGRRRSPFRSLLLLGVLLTTTAVMLALAGVPIPYADSLNKSINSLLGGTKDDMLTYKVKRGTLPVTLTERGTLESSNNVDVYNKVENTTTIISILAEGTQVTKGQLVVELDAAQLKDQLEAQKIATASAKAALENALKTYDVALIAVEEYEKGTYPQSLQSAESDIILAKSDLVTKKEALDFTKKLHSFGYVPDSRLTQDTLNHKRSEITLQNAETKLDVLKRFTRHKTLKELNADVEKALADKLAKQTTYDLEKQKEDKLNRQIESCKIYAPDDGMIVYFNDPNSSMRGNSAPQIEEGATVRERQKIFVIPDLHNMQVNTKVNEAMIYGVKPGQRCRVRVEAQAGDPLTGTVSRVATMADQASFFSSDVKVYTTLVKIDNSPPTIRPGMSAQVEILIEQLEDVISVPVQAILSFGGNDYVYIRKGDEWDRVQVKLGTSNDKLIEVKEGLTEGQEVALSPLSLMSEEEKQKVFGAGAKGATAKDWSGADAAKSKEAGEKAEKTEGKTEKKARKGTGGAGGGMMDPAAREAFMKMSPEEQRKTLIDRGMPEEMVDRILERMKSGGGGGGGPGGGPPGGGGPGGPPGGGQQ